jgi:hypothetical protein
VFVIGLLGLVEQNSTIIFPLPIDLIAAFRNQTVATPRLEEAPLHV